MLHEHGRATEFRYSGDVDCLCPPTTSAIYLRAVVYLHPASNGLYIHGWDGGCKIWKKDILNCDLIIWLGNHKWLEFCSNLNAERYPV